jgi:hypothetical protein
MVARFLLLGGLIGGTGLAARAAPLTCPPSIAITEALSGNPPEGWQSSSDATPRQLAGVSFFDGDPKQQRSLAPTRDTRAGKDRQATWQFGQTDEPVWLSCRYLDTGVVLAKPLAKPLHECRVVYGAGGIVKTITCQ